MIKQFLKLKLVLSLAALLAIIMAMSTLLPGFAQRASAAGGGSCNAFPHAYNLGAVWSDGNVSVPTCGPLPISGGSTASVHPYPGSLSTPGYQCVEYSERYLYYRYYQFSVTMPIPTNGAQIVDHYVAKYPGLFTAVANGTPYQAPQRGDVLSFSYSSAFSDTGHTAVVASSSVDGAGNGSIVIYEENAKSGGSETVNVHSWLVSRGSSYAKWMHVPQAPPPPPAQSSKTVGEARRPDGTMDVFVRGTDGAPYHLWLDANGNLIHGYESLGGSVQGAMVGSWTADGKHLDVFGVGTDGSIYRDRYDSPNTSFNGWTLVPGGGTAG